MRVKICGITTREHALQAAQAGADAIGLNFVAGPRRIEPPTASSILEALPPFVTPVALVRLSEGGEIADDVSALLRAHRISHVQLYGTVTPEAVGRLANEGLRPIVVVHVADANFDESAAMLVGGQGPSRPAAVVLDAYEPGRAGGTGRAFHWPWIAGARQTGRLDGWPPIILAGGLRPENVAEAVATADPWGVDVASGVESEDGVKDIRKMRDFVAAARRAAATP